MSDQNITGGAGMGTAAVFGVHQKPGDPPPPTPCSWDGERDGCGVFGIRGQGNVAAWTVDAGRWALCEHCRSLPRFADYGYKPMGVAR